MNDFLNTYKLMPIQEKLLKYGLENGKTYLAPTNSILIQNSKKELFLDAIAVFRHNSINPDDKFKFIDNHCIVSIVDNAIIIEISSAYKNYLDPMINDEIVQHEPYIRIANLLSL